MHSPVSSVGVLTVLCRLGLYGQVGRMVSYDGILPERGSQVLCRTARGLEVAEVLAGSRAELRSDPDGTLIRVMTPEDHLLWSNLGFFSSEAMEECSRMLEESGLGGLLFDVEPLMDGKTLYFHFLGDVPSTLTDRLQSLCEVYQKKVIESEFARLLEHGCGPGCGTEEKSGCGPEGGACAVCVVASACKKK